MGKKQITIGDVALQAGVSKTTVSRYLNGRYEFMSEETKARIAAVISENGYRPNKMANSLKTNRSGLIGVVMSNVMSTQTPVLLSSICGTCAIYGKKIIIVNSEQDPEKEKKLVYDLLEQRVDGLLVISGYNGEFYQALDRNELPVVLADRIPKYVDMDSIAINHAESTCKVINHLIDQGYEHIVLLMGNHPNPNSTISLRAQAAFDTCKKRFGTEQHYECITFDRYDLQSTDANKWFQAITKILKTVYDKRETRSTAIFVAESAAMEAITCGYYQIGLTISSRFTIAGYSNWYTGSIITPPISTIVQPLERLGQLATERLVQRIDSKDNSGDHVCETSYLSCRVFLSDAPKQPDTDINAEEI